MPTAKKSSETRPVRNWKSGPEEHGVCSGDLGHVWAGAADLVHDWSDPPGAPRMPPSSRPRGSDAPEPSDNGPSFKQYFGMKNNMKVVDS